MMKYCFWSFARYRIILYCCLKLKRTFCDCSIIYIINYVVSGFLYFLTIMWLYNCIIRVEFYWNFIEMSHKKNSKYIEIPLKKNILTSVTFRRLVYHWILGIMSIIFKVGIIYVCGLSRNFEIESTMKKTLRQTVYRY